MFFLENDALRENFHKFVPKEFIATPIDVLYSNFVKFGRRKSVKSCIRCALESESNIRLKRSFEPNNNTTNNQHNVRSHRLELVLMIHRKIGTAVIRTALTSTPSSKNIVAAHL